MHVVSVILPVHNGSEWVSQAVESILHQTYKNFELVIIDDGSTDNSKKIVTNYLCDKRVRYVYQENKGFSAAINRGINESIGSLIGFIGQDDLWMPYKLGIQEKYFAENKTVDFIHSNYCTIDSRGNFLRTRKIRVPKSLDYKTIIKELFLENFIGFETVLIKKSCFTNAGFFDERMVGFSDHDMWLRIAELTNMHYIDIPVVKKREHKLQLTQKTEVVIRDEFLMVQKMVNRYSFLRRVERTKLASLYYELGIALLKKGDYQKAKEELIKVIKYQPWAWKAAAIYFAPALYIHMLNHYSFYQPKFVDD